MTRLVSTGPAGVLDSARWRSPWNPVSRQRSCVDGGFAPVKAPPEVDPFNFAPHVSVPVLMLNGASDTIYQVEVGQRPLFVRLGTPEPRKRHVLFPGGGHGFVDQLKSQMVRETLDWLDQYLGPVK